MLPTLLAFTALLTWTLSDLLVKHAISKESTWSLIFWTQFFGGAFILGSGIILNFIPEISWSALLWITLLGAINFFGMNAFYKAIEKKGLALALPVVYSWAIPSVILGVIFLKEIPTTLHWIGLITIIGGLFMVTHSKKSRFLIDPSFLLAFLSMLTWGLFYFLIRDPGKEYGEFLTSGGLKVVTAMMAFPFLFVKKPHKKIRKMQSLLPICAIGILDAIGLVAITKGLQLGTTAVVTGIIATCPVIVAVCGVLFYKEKVDRFQGLGIALAGAGLILLTI